MRKTVFTIAASLCCAMALLTGCHGKGVSYPAPDTVHVADVYRIMYDYARADSAARATMIGTDTAEVRAFMSVVSELPVTDLRLQAWGWALPTIVFTPAVDSIYPHGTDSVSLAIGNVTARMRSLGVELAPRRYAAVVWGRPESVLFVDSIMLIALNHYLGAEYDGYSHFPLYMRLTKEPRLMPYDIAEAVIATDRPYVNEQGSALQRMLYEGALAAAKIDAVQGGNIADALAYRPEQMQFILDEEPNLWRRLVADGLLYDTSPVTVDKLVAPAPNTSLLDIRCPGRVGRYIGYKIVEGYRNRHPEATLSYLLSPEFYNNPDVLAQSGYNP